MKFILMLFFLTSPLYAQDAEADLQLPVEDVSQMQKEEEEQIPTLEEVEMKNVETKSETKASSKERKKDVRVDD